MLKTILAPFVQAEEEKIQQSGVGHVKIYSAIKRLFDKYKTVDDVQRDLDIISELTPELQKLDIDQPVTVVLDGLNIIQLTKIKNGKITIK